MMNPYQFYPREQIETAASPLVYAIYVDDVQECAQWNFGRELNDDELQMVKNAFDDADKVAYWDEAIGIVVGYGLGPEECEDQLVLL